MVLKLVYVKQRVQQARVTITRIPRAPQNVEDDIVENADYGIAAEYDPVKRAQAMARLYMTLMKKE